MVRLSVELVNVLKTVLELSIVSLIILMVKNTSNIIVTPKSVYSLHSVIFVNFISFSKMQNLLFTV